MNGPTDVEFVKAILDELESQPNRVKARVIVKRLGCRLRQRTSGCAEDLSQPALQYAGDAPEDR